MNKYFMICIAALVLPFSFIASADAAQRRVSSSDEIHVALRAAIPGDTLVMADGVWMDKDILFQGRGTPDAPITLRAETPGKVVLRGTSQMRIAGMDLVVDGLKFTNGHQSLERVVSRKYGLGLEPVVKFLKDRDGSKWTTHCRLTNCHTFTAQRRIHRFEQRKSNRNSRCLQCGTT